MRITKVVIRRFKRFEHTEFDIPNDCIVFAGPNNTGKTTLLQAMATWALTLGCWLRAGDHNVYTNGYARVPLARQAFYSVPLRNFNLLWHSNSKHNKKDPIQIEVYFENVGSLTIEILYNTTEQIYVRPVYEKNDIHVNFIATTDFWYGFILPKIVYVSAMAGIAMEEPLYQPAKVDQLLGQGRPGEVLRNLLVQTYENEKAWDELSRTINFLFGYMLQPPQTSGANIVAEYVEKGVQLDIASAGSGFLQILMLLTFLSSNKKAVLLLDEPDAHLHILLQDKILSVLKDFTHDSDSRLIIATHSERIINATEPRDLFVVLDDPRPIANTKELNAVITSLTALDNTDIMLARDAQGILYVEGHTDISLLRTWADILGHELFDFLNSPFWKPTVYQPVDHGKGIQAEAHYEAILLVDNISGLELRDSDGYERTDKELDNGLKRIFWHRYEIESYLIHPDPIARFVKLVGEQGAEEKARTYLKDQLPPAVYNNPLEENDYLNNTKAKGIINKTMQAAGIHNFVDHYRIIECTKQNEIHPEVIEKLDTIAKHFAILKK